MASRSSRELVLSSWQLVQPWFSYPSGAKMAPSPLPLLAKQFCVSGKWSRISSLKPCYSCFFLSAASCLGRHWAGLILQIIMFLTAGQLLCVQYYFHSHSILYCSWSNKICQPLCGYNLLFPSCNTSKIIFLVCLDWWQSRDWIMHGLD